MAVTALDISLIFVASAAFLVSLTTLWKTHFAKCNVLVAAGYLRHRIYPIKNDGWYITSFDIPLSFTNSGAKPGIITGLRLKLHYSNLPVPDNHEYVYPQFEIDPKNYKQISKDRFKWIEKLLLSYWMPFIILPKSSISKHIVFETRWDDPVIQDKIDCSLEIEIDHKGNWFSVCNWSLKLHTERWSNLVCGISMSYSQVGKPHGFRNVVHPQDLHKYTGSKDPLKKMV